MTPGYEAALERFEDLERVIANANDDLASVQELLKDLAEEYSDARQELYQAERHSVPCSECAAGVDEPCRIDGAPSWSHTARGLPDYREEALKHVSAS